MRFIFSAASLFFFLQMHHPFIFTFFFLCNSPTCFSPLVFFLHLRSLLLCLCSFLSFLLHTPLFFPSACNLASGWDCSPSSTHWLNLSVCSHPSINHSCLCYLVLVWVATGCFTVCASPSDSLHICSHLPTEPLCHPPTQTPSSSSSSSCALSLAVYDIHPLTCAASIPLPPQLHMHTH